MTIAVEPPNEGWIHCVTPDDIAAVLRLIPSDDLVDLGLVALRQPTRKQELIEPVWGRLRYHVEIGRYAGACVILEAHRPDIRVTWKRPGIAGRAEIDRLRADGHRVTPVHRNVEVEYDAASIRRTQLYRTLPHEVGHYVDYLTKVERGPDDAWFRLWERYWSRPSEERETFAHRYADEFRRRHEAAGTLPFPQIADANQMRVDGLDPAWFGLQSV